MRLRDRAQRLYLLALPPDKSRVKRLSGFALAVLILFLLIQNFTLNRHTDRAIDDLHDQQQVEIAREDALFLVIAQLQEQVRQLCDAREDKSEACVPIAVPSLTPIPGVPSPSQPGLQPAVRGETPSTGSSKGGGSSSSPSARPRSPSKSPEPSRTPSRQPSPTPCVAQVGGVCVPTLPPSPLASLRSLVPLVAPDGGGLLDQRPAAGLTAYSDRDRRVGGPGAAGYAALGLLVLGGLGFLGWIVRSKDRARSGVQRKPPA